jgi:predicted RNA-binding Zn-ribbon protein involved in translation (DUF1610 family)
MWYLPLVVVVLAAGAFAGVSRLRSGFPASKQVSDPGTGIHAVESLSMEQINLLLARLEKEEAPEPQMGAMCYAPMAIADSAEYICPDCGEKTVYGGGMSPYLQYELDTARRLAESINASTDFDVVLDESSFCEFCSEYGEGSAVLVLRVTGENGEETANSVSVDDLRRLNWFLRGSLFWVTSNDGHAPLRGHSERMAELLGI